MKEEEEEEEEEEERVSKSVVVVYEQTGGGRRRQAYKRCRGKRGRGRLSGGRARSTAVWQAGPKTERAAAAAATLVMA
jgi:hypothetical protein